MIGTQKKIITYIIRTLNGEYYCGKTRDLERRLKEHKVIEKNSWFKYKSRLLFDLEIAIEGDYEKEIKRFGIKKFMLMIKELRVSLS